MCVCLCVCECVCVPNLLLCSESLSKGSIIEAYHADSLQFDDTLSHGDQVEDGAKRLSLECPI